MKFKDKYGDYTGKTWKGDLSCSYNNLTSLEGCPEVVEGYFNCSYNKLTSLEGCPEVVKGDFYCNNNNLYELTEEYLKTIVKAKDYYFDYILKPLTLYCKELKNEIRR